MNIADFTYLLSHPQKVVDPLQTKHLEDILEEYPYFQAARALHLKGLKNLNSYKYNKALKTTAAHTTDREILFHFITSTDYLADSTPKAANEGITSQPETTALETQDTPAPFEASEETGTADPQDANTLMEGSRSEAERILDPMLFKKKNAAEQLEIGKPLDFDKKEKYSFSEWLTLATQKHTSNAEADDPKESIPPNKDEPPEGRHSNTGDKKDKFNRIDAFIAKNPKIVPRKDTKAPSTLADSMKFDKNELMTETLARVYLEQKKYKKAIQAYKILSLKYPEKSGFFADQIKAVEQIKKENKDSK